MIEIADNFLDKEQFKFLQGVAKKISTNKNKQYFANQKAYSVVHPIEGDDTVRMQYIYGKDIIGIIDKAKSFIASKIEDIPNLASTWFTYCNIGYVIPKHQDIPSVIDIATLSKNCKVFIFCHDYWDADWGGELGFKKFSVVPKPNRLVLYTPDEWHFVKIINEQAKKTRTYFGIRWGNYGYKHLGHN